MEALPHSNLCDVLLGKIGHGMMHVSDSVHLSRASTEDGNALEQVKMFATLGTSAKWETNYERDLHNWTRGLYNLKVQPYRLMLRLKTSKNMIQETAVPIITPHEMMHAIWAYGENQFFTSFLGNDGETPLEFWKCFLSSGLGTNHPGLAGATHAILARLIPVMIHFDGVEFHRNTEFYVWSWSSLIASGGSVSDVKFLMCVIPGWMMPSKRLLQGMIAEVSRFIGHCLRTMREGVCPALGFYGEELKGFRGSLAGATLAGGWMGTFAGCKSDGKARVQLNRFARNYHATFCCDLCFAVNPFPRAPPHLRFSDFTVTAGWRPTIIDHETYLETERVLSHLVVIDGWRIELNFWDRLHVKCLGFDRDVAAYVIKEFVMEGRIPGETFEDRLETLSKYMREWWKENRLTPFRINLTPGNIGLGSSLRDYPELASTFKGCHVQIIMKYLTAKACGEFNDGSAHAQLRATMMWGQAEFDHVCDSGGLILTWDEVHRAQHGGTSFLLAFQALANEAETLDIKMYKPRPKLHDFQHMLMSLTNRINPKWTDAFNEETFMGVTKRIGRMTRGANHSALWRTLDRYILGLAVRFERRRRTGTLFVESK